MYKIGDNCPHCKEDKLVFINGNEPYNIDHLQCPKCDSTYILEEKSNKVKVVTREVKEKLLKM